MDGLFCFSFFLFLFFSIFYDGTTCIGEENCASLHVTYRNIVIIFKSVELEHTPSSFPQPKIDLEVIVRSQKINK